VRIETTFFRSRVARRIFTLFICCAVVPIAALAILSLWFVTGQLQAQSQRRLHQASRAMGLAYYERMLLLDAELKRSVPGGRVAAPGSVGLSSGALAGQIAEHFKGLVLVAPPGRSRPLSGQIDPLPELSPDERQAIQSEKTAVISRLRPGQPPRLFMARTLDLPDPGSTFLLGEIDTEYLWGATEGVPLPPHIELCLVEASERVLTCPVPLPPPALARATRKEVRSGPIQFEWTSDEEKYLASAWPIFMQSRFAAPTWTVVLSEPKTEVFAAAAYFKTIFPPVILFSLCVVILLGVGQIRRSLVPLERLREGTRRIAGRDFASRVSVTSGDEFEELANSFNAMAERLGRQFNALTTLAEITQVVLSSLETRKIVDTVLARMGDVCPCDRVGMILVGSARDGAASLYLQDAESGREVWEVPIRLTMENVEALRANPAMSLPSLADFPAYIAALARRDVQACLLFPIFLQYRLAAVVILGYRDTIHAPPEDLDRARQLADQLAVALTNARLIEELDQLNWGTLRALARAIDAKSPWTAGHSERVTNVALDIGRAMGLEPKTLDVMHRGGLLHDIGKIGIPATILDKPGPLSKEEVAIMRGHVRLGARILEPIAAYGEAIPIVLHHHEAYDGTGYPDGLAGKAINLGARIFSVADVFEALTSDRPYRAGMPAEQVIAYIRERSGQQFDPTVVKVFLRVMSERGLRPADEAPAAPRTSLAP
jgi:putative nucleotidyltransferase with HDIG domain